MILDLKLNLGKKGEVLDTPADYDPSDAVKLRTSQVMKDFANANTIRNRPYTEFNNLTLIDRMNTDQMSWNAFVDGPSEDPADAWKSRAFRPIVRNKIITIAAHVAAAVIYPRIYAQNDRDEEDRDAATVMRDLVEWANEQAKYDRRFIYAVIAALVNPAVVMHSEYAEHEREIKEIQADGSYKVKKIPDDIYSGFIDTIVPIDELWIANIYEHDIQRQPFLIWRRVIDYSTARAKYHGNTAFDQYVRPGVQYLYSDDLRSFYEQYDQTLRANLVEEVIYYNRTADLQIAFVNGVLMDDVNKPNPRKDKLYPFSKSGYELIDEGRFFFYKSLPFKTSPDEEVVNTLYRMVIDGTYLQIMPPAVVYGNEEINTTVIAPGVVTTIDNSVNPNASFQTIATNNNLTAGQRMLDKVESSINESTTDILQSGQEGSGSQTAYEISRLEANARVMLGLFAKMIGMLVQDWGTLRVGDVLQFMTVGTATDLLSTDERLKFRTFLLPDRTVEGKTKTRRIEFTTDLPDEMTPDQQRDESFKILAEETKNQDKVELYRVNPTLFRDIKFKVKTVAEPILPKSDTMQKALNLEAYALAMANPVTNKSAITRELLFGSFDKTKDDPDRYMAQPGVTPEGEAGNVPVPAGGASETPPTIPPAPGGGGKGKLLQKLLGNEPK